MAIMAPAGETSRLSYIDFPSVLIACLPFVALAIPGLLSDYGMQVAFRLMIFIALAEAWNLLAGYGGLVSLGSAAFVGIGAYVFIGVVNQLGLPIPAALCIAAVSGGLVAFLAAPAIFRMRGLYFTVGTLAIGEALRLLMINVPIFGGSSGLILRADWPEPLSIYLWAALVLAGSQVVMALYTRSRMSVLIRAVRDDEDAAAQFGVRTFRIKLGVFVLASIVMSAAGALQGYKLGAVEPYGMFGLSWSIDVLVIVIIGGIGSRLGALVGSIFYIALGELFADFPEIHVAITGVILIVVIRFAPRGLTGLLAQVMQTLSTAGVLRRA
jgi:branched-chain amino acid transport system permease protein